MFNIDTKEKEIKIEEINNDDLSSKQYDESILVYNMKRGTLTPYMIIKYQKKLSNEFIAGYILNEKYAAFNEDYDITINKIILKYPDFAKFDLKSYINKSKK